MKRTIIFVLAIAYIFAVGNAQTVDEILLNNIKVKGGAEKLESVTTVTASGKMVRMNMEMAFGMWYKKPKMTKMEINISDKKMIFAFDGKTVWQISPFTGIEGAQVMTGDQADDIKENAEMFENPFINYKEKGNKIELIGKEELEGTEVFKIKLTKKNGKVITFFIDTESFIELKTETIKKKKDGKEIKFESYYGDFKEVDGMMTAFSIKTKINGTDMGNIIIESIKYNEPIDDSFFKMPKEKEKKE